MTEADDDVDEQHAPTMAEGPESEIPASELSEGAVVNERYRIIRKLGAGGMGTVYLAEHLGLRTSVAIKLLAPHLQHNRDYVRRFEREARATYRLQHPNIVRVIDFGQTPNLHIAMEFIQGRTLAEHLEACDEPPPLAFVRAVTKQLLEASAAAHRAGIVHRDLKPDNVLLSYTEGRGPNVKVLDFGLARFDDQADRGPTLTQNDIVAGTPAYMSPEQCQSLGVGEPTDLYAIGCILTEMLQLKPPFDASSAAVLMSQQMFVPAPALKRPEHSEPVPPILEQLRCSLLEKQPHARPESAVEARRLLLSAFDSSNDPARVSRTPVRSRGGVSSGSDRPSSDPTLTIAVRLIGGTDPGINEGCKMGLSANGVQFVEDAGLVLVDLELPIEELCARVSELRAASAEAQLMVCATSTDATTLRSLIAAGAADVVKYPIAPHELIKQLRRLARRRPSVPPIQ